MQFHIQGDLTSYTKEDIYGIVVTVAAILKCYPEDIRVNGLKRSESVMLILSIKKTYSCKLSFLNIPDWMRLVELGIDYLILDKDKIILKKPQGMIFFNYWKSLPSSSTFSFYNLLLFLSLALLYLKFHGEDNYHYIHIKIPEIDTLYSLFQ